MTRNLFTDLFPKSSIKSRKKTKDFDSSEISETNELNELSKSPEDSVVSNEEGATGGGGYGICNCRSTTGIHQSGCNEYSDGPGEFGVSKYGIIIVRKADRVRIPIYYSATEFGHVP